MRLKQVFLISDPPARRKGEWISKNDVFFVVAECVIRKSCIDYGRTELPSSCCKSSEPWLVSDNNYREGNSNVIQECLYIEAQRTAVEHWKISLSDKTYNYAMRHWNQKNCFDLPCSFNCGRKTGYHESSHFCTAVISEQYVFPFASCVQNVGYQASFFLLLLFNQNNYCLCYEKLLHTSDCVHVINNFWSFFLDNCLELCFKMWGRGYAVS